MDNSPASVFIVIMYASLLAGTIFCAVQAIRASRLLTSALWLAGVSALVAVLLYSIGGREVAVIELSVGAGLVTVLFVFAINIAGEEATLFQSVLPKPLAWTLVLLALILLGWLTLPITDIIQPIPEPIFAGVLWEQRGLDLLVQIVLIFSGVLGILGLLAGTRRSANITTLQHKEVKKVEAPFKLAIAESASKEING